jgi:hypothetical protein
MSASVRDPPVLEPLLAAIARARPVYGRLFAEGERTLGAFVRAFAAVPFPAIQSRSDYIAQVERQVSAAQGGLLAAKVRARLERSPVVFTANHLGLESLPLTVQSLVVAALGEEPGGALPVEASGLIPADNASFPVGFTLARRSGGRALRLPVLALPRRMRHRLTMLLEPFQAADLDQAQAAAQALAATGQIGAGEFRALGGLLSTVLRSSGVLDRQAFSGQAKAANGRFWETWFTPEALDALPALAYSQIEAIRTPLLVDDLRAPATLANRLLFDRALREAVLRGLDGVNCCWTGGGKQGGSAFFWEVGPAGKAARLIAEGDCLVAEGGRRIPLEPSPLVDELLAGTLVPTSFLSLTLGLARGLVQVGGFNQVDYLASIQEGLAEALAATGYSEWAGRLRRPLPPMLTAAFAPVAACYADGLVASAGGIELMAHGGLDLADLERMKSLSLREALALELPGIARMVLGDRAARELAGPGPDVVGVPGPDLLERLLVVRP